MILRNSSIEAAIRCHYLNSLELCSHHLYFLFFNRALAARVKGLSSEFQKSTSITLMRIPNRVFKLIKNSFTTSNYLRGFSRFLIHWDTHQQRYERNTVNAMNRKRNFFSVPSAHRAASFLYPCPSFLGVEVFFSRKAESTNSWKYIRQNRETYIAGWFSATDSRENIARYVFSYK